MKKKLLPIIVVSIFIISVIVGVIYFITNNDKKEGEKTNQEDQANVSNEEVEEFVKVLDDGKKVNTSSKLNETKYVDGYEIGNIELSTVDGQTTLYADVKNNTGKDADVKAIEITLYDENGGVIVTMGGVITDAKNGETVKLEASTTLDFANAYDFKVEIL